MHRAIRAVSVVLTLVAVAYYVYRSQLTPEQEELTRYVEVAVPRLQTTEARLDAQLRRLTQAPGLAAAPARALLIDEIIPDLLALRAQVSEQKWQTGTVKQLVQRYDEVVLAQIEACRTAVRVIDDPTLDTKTATARVRDAFAHASVLRAAWKAQLAQSCRVNGLHSGVQKTSGAAP